MKSLLIDVRSDVKIRFPFEKYIDSMVCLVPHGDIVGLEKIVIENEAHTVSDQITTNTEAFYLRDRNFNRGQVILVLGNIVGTSIPLYAFESYPEIGGLLLSEIVFHEIGHHVHFSKRHGVKKQKYEKFAETYAKAGYFNYLSSRSSKILSSYRWASFNILAFNKKERHLFADARKELINCLARQEGTIKFP